MTCPDNTYPTPCPAITVEQFRGFKPAFSDSARYPDGMIEYWIMIAAIMLNASRWRAALPFGTTLFVAHNCYLEAQQNVTAAVGGFPGVARGPISSETPGSVALSYAVEQTSEKNGGYYNLSVYGTQFIRYARLIGAGPTYLGIGFAPFYSIANGVAWNGPWNGPEGPGWGT